MYKQNKHIDTNIRINNGTEGETIEMKMARITRNGEPLTDGAPIIYTDHKDGVLPQYDIRTDKMEEALKATDKNVKNSLARREALLDDLNKKTDGAEGKPKSERKENSQNEANSDTSK